MRIAIGSDHAGFAMKELLSSALRDLGHRVADLGTDDPDVPVDYPDFGAAVARDVAGGRADLGVCVCGTGIGISMAANKVPGARAAVVHDATTAALARRHNHANVLCFGSRTLGPATAVDALAAFLTASPEHGRHDRRVQKLAELDAPPGADRQIPVSSVLASTGGAQ
ncbi:MAG TPA: ribose 5-phosphate isomerase B [Acidimicrobiales bacterium]|nr:ribose 5-phosphate isomerase B [Acidimicrobiales bacterium]